ncbi:MAG TPA: septal ring lytic transglycosylase RlpA family protein [Candidatus Acidoferrales bacterium]|nr:septal ring lytic transglycosylase RlpA family protein [Candidatus Acidoferrales bacterium]
MRGASVAEITSDLRTVYGRAYRRSDLLADVRSYRGPIATITTTSAAIETALSTYRDLRGFIARIGVAAFSISLLLPTIVHGGASSHVSLASTFADTTYVAVERIALPNAREASRLVAPEPAVEEMRLLPETNSGEPATGGVIVTASWYGPGFYDNRLPCWPWLQAHGLPIQFEADTWGVANKTLPCGTMLTLSHGSNVITVPVVDRGPYVAGRELDLSLRVKTALGCTDLCTVLMQIDQ